MSPAGRFIVLEGGDGVGKTTHVALISGWLESLGIDHVVVREPGGTPVGEAIREVVLGSPDLEMPPESELLLIQAARAALVRDVIEPALARDQLVLADRFALSTLAYQAFARGIDPDTVRRAIEVATGGLRPDLYVVLDLPVEESVERGHRGNVDPDRIEQEGADFRRTVREAYLALAGSEPGVEVVSGRGTPEEVHQRIRELLEARLPELLGRGAVDRRGSHGR